MFHSDKIVLFDGECNLCDSSVTFILKRDKKRHFRFASLQSPTGQAILEKFSLPKEKRDTVLLIEGNRIYDKSTASLRIAMRLQGLWPLLCIFFIIPAFLRDILYAFIAKNRFWFGKKTSCMMAKEEWKGLFI